MSRNKAKAAKGWDDITDPRHEDELYAGRYAMGINGLVYTDLWFWAEMRRGRPDRVTSIAWLETAGRFVGPFETHNQAILAIPVAIKRSCSVCVFQPWLLGQEHGRPLPWAQLIEIAERATAATQRLFRGKGGFRVDPKKPAFPIRSPGGVEDIAEALAVWSLEHLDMNEVSRHYRAWDSACVWPGTAEHWDEDHEANERLSDAARERLAKLRYARRGENVSRSPKPPPLSDAWLKRGKR